MLQLLTSHYMHILPLIAATSIVYGATRDERPVHILVQIVRSAIWMIFFLGLIMAFLFVIGWFLRG
jgi:hypothetical protein